MFEGTPTGATRMKETDEDRAVRERVESVAAAELRSFVERVERLNIERADIADQTKEVFAEAKGRGYDTKALRKIIAERKKDADQRAEEAAIFEMYAAALGM